MFDIADKIEAAFIKNLSLWKKDKQRCREVFCASISCLISLKRNIWSCLQIYQVYSCNIYLSSSQNSLSTFRRIYQAMNGSVIPSSNLPNRLYWTRKRRLYLPYQYKDQPFSIGFRGISWLGSAFIFLLRWFKFAHICIQVTSLHKWKTQRINKKILIGNRFHVTLRIVSPIILFK